jgi:hypothetical protein
VTLIKSSFLSYIFLSSKKIEERIIFKENIQKYFEKHTQRFNNQIYYSKLNPTRCKFIDLFNFTDALNVSGGYSAHHQEHINSTYSFRYCEPIKVKVKCTLVQALRFCTGRTAHRGSRGIALLYRH